MKRLTGVEGKKVILDWLVDISPLAAPPPQQGYVLDRKDPSPRNFWVWAKKAGVEALPNEVALAIEELIKEEKVHLLLKEEGPIGFRL